MNNEPTMNEIIDAMLAGDIPAHKDDLELLRHYGERASDAHERFKAEKRKEIGDALNGIRGNLAVVSALLKDGDTFRAGEAFQRAYSDASNLLKAIQNGDIL